MRQSDRDAEAIFDYAVDKPNGFTYLDIERDLHINYHRFHRAVPVLRRILGDGDQINLICNKAGFGQPFIYVLAGNLDDQRWWMNNRQRDGVSRFQGMLKVNESLVSATDPATIDGKQARLIKKTISRLIEDMQELTAAESMAVQ